jgi:hypothetical protein
MRWYGIGRSRARCGDVTAQGAGGEQLIRPRRLLYDRDYTVSRFKGRLKARRARKFSFKQEIMVLAQSWAGAGSS